MICEATLKLTVAQANWIDWALTGPIAEWGDIDQFCHDRGCPREDAEQAIRDRDASHLDGTTLTLSCDPAGDFAADLLNQLEDIAPDVEDGYGFEDAQTRHGWSAAHVVTAARKKSALTAARKIRQALGIDR